MTTVPAVLTPELAAQLEQAGKQTRKWVTKRDALIVEATASGASLREIAAVVGLTHTGVRRVLQRSTSDLDPAQTADTP